MKKQLQEIPRGGLKFDEYIDPEFMYEVQEGWSKNFVDLFHRNVIIEYIVSLSDV